MYFNILGNISDILNVFINSTKKNNFGNSSQFPYCEAYYMSVSEEICSMDYSLWGDIAVNKSPFKCKSSLLTEVLKTASFPNHSLIFHFSLFMFTNAITNKV